MIQEHLETILHRYARARAGEPFGKRHELWPVFEAAAGELSTQPAVARRPHLKVTWSAGQGGWAKVPWIALLDDRETTTTQRGVYCVYLFRQDMSGVYVTFNQGVTQPTKERGSKGARQWLRSRAQTLRSFCAEAGARGFSLEDDIDLKADPGLGANYEYSTIAHKLYPADQVPDEPTLMEDLEAVLLAYDRYVAQGESAETEDQPLVPPEDVRTESVAPAFMLSSAVRHLHAQLASRGFIFEPWQVATFVTALRTKPFVLLAGVTGTGKSKLPLLVAELTGGRAELLPVRPDWTDSSDVLGYTDLQGDFRPGLVLQTARDAEAQAQRQWFCILDEMNLARVEQYFAEVLSRLEDRRPAAGGGHKSGRLLNTVCGENAAEWASVVLPANLALVGTVNMDETTHGFSRKVLDRAFTIELSDVDLSRWGPQAVRPGASRGEQPWPVSAWQPRAISLASFATPTPEERALIDNAIQILAAANRFLAPAQLQVGYRTRDEVGLFLVHAAEVADLFVTGEGVPVAPLDLALVMKVLPRIVGGSTGARMAVYGLLSWAWGDQATPSPEAAQSCVETWRELGRPAAVAEARFPRTAARLCLMWERFESDGYTSFWL